MYFAAGDNLRREVLYQQNAYKPKRVPCKQRRPKTLDARRGTGYKASHARQ
jgi:hypothetical protein